MSNFEPMKIYQSHDICRKGKKVGWSRNEVNENMLQMELAYQVLRLNTEGWRDHTGARQQHLKARKYRVQGANTHPIEYSQMFF